MATSTQWQLAHEAAQRYEQILVPAVLGPAARALVERAQPRAGEAVVDIGCGTGAAARFAAAAVGPSGRVVGIDVNAGMIEVARAASAAPAAAGAAAIEWREHSAYQLPFADGEFDLALCAQTLQFLEERPRALAQMHRVLRPGGRVAVSVWCDVRQSPYFDALVQAVTRHVGAETAAGLRAAFGLADAQAVRALLTAAGFDDVQATVQELPLELPKPADFVPRHVSATPMAAGFQAASEEARRAVVREVSEQMRRYEAGAGVRVPFATHLVLGRR